MPAAVLRGKFEGGALPPGPERGYVSGASEAMSELPVRAKRATGGAKERSERANSAAPGVMRGLAAWLFYIIPIIVCEATSEAQPERSEVTIICIM